MRFFDLFILFMISLFSLLFFLYNLLTLGYSTLSVFELNFELLLMNFSVNEIVMNSLRLFFYEKSREGRDDFIPKDNKRNFKLSCALALNSFLSFLVALVFSESFFTILSVRNHFRTYFHLSYLGSELQH